MPSHGFLIDFEVDDQYHFTVTGTRSTSHRRERDYFQWLTNSGELEIDFPNGHPFDSPRPYKAHVHNRTKAVRVLPDASPGQYKYTITITPQNNEDPCVYDPEIFIDADLEDEVEVLAINNIQEIADGVLTGLFTRLKDSTGAGTDTARLFFPRGIETIWVDVEVGPAKVALKVAGPASGDPTARAKSY